MSITDTLEMEKSKRFFQICIFILIINFVASFISFFFLEDQFGIMINGISVNFNKIHILWLFPLIHIIILMLYKIRINWANYNPTIYNSLILTILSFVSFFSFLILLSQKQPKINLGIILILIFILPVAFLLYIIFYMVLIEEKIRKKHFPK